MIQTFLTDIEYKNWIAKVKQQIHQSRVKVALAANTALIEFQLANILPENLKSSYNRRNRRKFVKTNRTK